MSILPKLIFRAIPTKCQSSILRSFRNPQQTRQYHSLELRLPNHAFGFTQALSLNTVTLESYLITLYYRLKIRPSPKNIP